MNVLPQSATAYLHLETDDELRRRVTILAGHRVHPTCCTGYDSFEAMDATAARHGTARKIVEVFASQSGD